MSMANPSEPIRCPRPPLSPHLLTRTSYEVNFDLVIELKSAIMTFSLEFDGVPMGIVKANFGA